MPVAVMTAEEILEQKGGEIYSVGVDASVRDALTQMVEHKVGSTLVKKGSRIVGSGPKEISCATASMRISIPLRRASAII